LRIGREAGCLPVNHLLHAFNGFMLRQQRSLNRVALPFLGFDLNTQLFDVRV
jgi:hypothetical protein